jgi:hypothetical protein
MKKIIISENKRGVLFSAILNESLTNGDESDKVLSVVKFLDGSFSRADENSYDDNGHPANKELVAWLTPKKEVAKLLTATQLFYVVQEEFKNLISDKKERDDFLKKVIKAWYYHNITKEGSIIEK